MAVPSRGVAPAAWTAVAAGGGAAFAWAACCLLPMALAAVGVVGAGGGLFLWFATYRVAFTAVAALALAAAWLLWARARTGCRRGACAAPSRTTVVLLALATALFALSLEWGRVIEPVALKALVGMRR